MNEAQLSEQTRGDASLVAGVVYVRQGSQGFSFGAPEVAEPDEKQDEVAPRILAKGVAAARQAERSDAVRATAQGVLVGVAQRGPPELVEDLLLGCVGRTAFQNLCGLPAAMLPYQLSYRGVCGFIVGRTAVRGGRVHTGFVWQMDLDSTGPVRPRRYLSSRGGFNGIGPEGARQHVVGA